MNIMKRIFVMLFAVIAWSALPSLAQTFTFTDKGAGMYTDASVAHQASTFTLNPNQVSCGVGTVDANGAFGPFEMEMASYTVDSYSIDRTSGTITATGHMRSQTRVAGVIIEDTNGVGNNPPPHAYVAIGHDGRGGASGALGLTNPPDHFDTHFKTPFWNTGNPLCSASTVVPGGCRFGGDLFLGLVAVGSKN
jgi:hypothetical protein